MRALVIAFGCLTACGSSPAPAPGAITSGESSSSAAGVPNAEGAAHRYPTRTEVVRAMSGPHLHDPLRACGLTGVFQVRLVFLGADGSVESVALVEPPRDDGNIPAVLSPEQLHLDPSAWACGERAFEALRVPPFEQATFTVSFPYRL